MKRKQALTHICYLLNQYSKENDLFFLHSVELLKAKTGYISSYYIPQKYDTIDLKRITSLSFDFLKIYAMSNQDFFFELINLHHYYLVHPYPPYCYQTELKLGG